LPTAAGPPLARVTALSGESTLGDAAEALGAELPLPAHPLGIGPPDRVFLQEVSGPMAVLAWLAPDRPDEAWLVLYVLRLEEGAFGGKFEVQRVQQTTVWGAPAFWVEGQHFLEFRDRAGRSIHGPARFVAGNVLVWEGSGLTYRLESGLSLDEAVRIAESMPQGE
jgi:hypothetical protein